jgi:nicotinate-nucleotide pyrophosphorylase (carboxylating)
LDKSIVDQFIISSLNEDVGDGDHTSLATISAGTKGKAKLLIKDEGILAGVELAIEIFHIVDPALKINILLNDGAKIKPNDIAQLHAAHEWHSNKNQAYSRFIKGHQY